MNYIRIFFLIKAFLMFSLPIASYSKEKIDYTCYKRGVEIIFPYETAIHKIKKHYTNFPAEKEKALKNFKNRFEKDFYGIPLYKEAGCSNARLSEYLECLISTDGKNCRIYYTQMRIVD